MFNPLTNNLCHRKRICLPSLPLPKACLRDVDQLGGEDVLWSFLRSIEVAVPHSHLDSHVLVRAPDSSGSPAIGAGGGTCGG